MSEKETKKAQQALNDVQDNLEHLHKLLGQMSIPGKEKLIEQMTGKNGLLRPLAVSLNKLLENPLLRQVMDNNPPPGTKKH